jgi:hypothetical protein
MSFWFPDVADYEEARGATKGGVYAALGFAAMIFLGLVLAAFSNDPEYQAAPPMFRYAVFGAMAVEIAVAVAAAWRFSLGKGWLIGSVALAFYAIELVVKLLSGFLGVLGYIIVFAILAGLGNGVRAAWSLRSMAQLPPEELASTFE